MSSDILQSILNDLSHLVVPPSRLTFENYAEIGVGGYGEVYLAILTGSSDAPPRKVAVKKLRIVQEKEIRSRIAIRLLRELKVWSSAKHPNILELIGFYLDENNGSAQFVSGYMAHGNAKDYIKRCQPNLALRLQFVQGITAGVCYLHTYNPPICHGDLKPSNVLVNDDIEVVLCDFGLATFIEASGVASGLTTSKSVKGSTRYMSPELLQRNGARHTLRSDMWAWACTAFEILTDCEPYHTAETEFQVLMSLARGESPGSVDMLNDRGRNDLALASSGSVHTPDDLELESFESSGSVHAPDDLELESFESSGSVHAPDDLELESFESSGSVHAPDDLPLESPGSIHAPDDPTPDDLALDTNINGHRTLDSLRRVISECWDSDSVKRPSSSYIINRVFLVEASDASSAPGVHGECQDIARLTLQTKQDTMDSYTNLLGEPGGLIGGSPYGEMGEKDGSRSNTSGRTLFPTVDAKRTRPGRKGTSHKASPIPLKRKRAGGIAPTPSDVSAAIHTDTISGPRKRSRMQLVGPPSTKSVNTTLSAAYPPRTGTSSTRAPKERKKRGGATEKEDAGVPKPVKEKKERKQSSKRGAGKKQGLVGQETDSRGSGVPLVAPMFEPQQVPSLPPFTINHKQPSSSTPTSPATSLVGTRPLEERIIHLLATKSQTIQELQSLLPANKDDISEILRRVATTYGQSSTSGNWTSTHKAPWALKLSSYALLQPWTWPGYTDRDRKRIAGDMEDAFDQSRLPPSAPERLSLQEGEAKWRKKQQAAKSASGTSVPGTAQRNLKMKKISEPPNATGGTLSASSVKQGMANRAL